jgi:hypothetical protein
MKVAAFCFATLALAGAAVAADENKDLDLIPKSSSSTPREEAASPATRGNQRVFLENALTLTTPRADLLVPSPPPLPPSWDERLFADARLEYPLAPNALVVYSGRLNLVLQDDLGFPNRGNVNHDLRELYASVEPWARAYLDAGRINVKSGVALGFNPTDYFKARAVIDPLTADPSALREDRLGTLMLRAQRVGETGSVSAVYAPRVTDPSPVGQDPYRGFNPLFGRTNGTNRWLVKASQRLSDELSPEALAYHDGSQWKFGANVTTSVGQSTVAYLEWSGGRRLGIIDEALAFGRETGTIPPLAPSVITQGGEEHFQSQVAVGASYTTESKITFNLEYHYNQAGFSRSDWDRWFALGEGQPESSPIARELWYIRSYANDRQEPLQRHGLFVRMDWVDFMVPKLELTGFVLADARDGSTLLQLEADYARTDLWTFGVLAGGTTGGRRSNFGSLPRGNSILLKAVRYF